MRWIHIASVVTLIGGFIYARFVLAPLAPEVGEAAARGFRPLLYTVLVTVIGSGIYNYATKASYPPGYHMWMGIKLLLVLHIAAASILYSVRAGDAPRRNRTALGIVISGLIAIAIADYLRYLSLK